MMPNKFLLDIAGSSAPSDKFVPAEVLELNAAPGAVAGIETCANAENIGTAIEIEDAGNDCRQPRMIVSVHGRVRVMISVGSNRLGIQPPRCPNRLFFSCIHQPFAGFGDEFRLRIGLQNTGIEFRRFVGLAKFLVALGGLKQRRSLPARVRVNHFHATDLARASG